MVIDGWRKVIDLGPKWLPGPPFGAKIDDQAGREPGNRRKTGALGGDRCFGWAETGARRGKVCGFVDRGAD
jgi:hypothetical protein